MKSSNELIYVVNSGVNAKTNTSGGTNFQSGMQWLSAMSAGTNSNIVGVENVGDIVWMRTSK
jgi:hypothetical protein